MSIGVAVKPTPPAAARSIEGLRVLFVTNRWPDEVRPWHGIAMKTQAESLRRLGIAVDVLPIIGYRARSSYLHAATRTAALNRHCPYDVVHAHYGHSAVVARLQLRAPLVVTYCGSDLLAAKPQYRMTAGHRLGAAVFRQLARVAAATITQSEEMAQLLPRSCRRRNRVIPEGVDLDVFRPLDRRLARRQLGWPDDEPVVLFVSDPRRPEKNFPLAKAVADRVACAVPGLRLRVAADVAPPEMPLWMSASDALLLTSRYEGGPSVVKEAMAAGLPVVSTPVGLLREALRGLPGLWVGPPDVGALAKSLEAALRGGRVPAARAAIRSLSLDSVAEQVASVYEAVAG